MPWQAEYLGTLLLLGLLAWIWAELYRRSGTSWTVLAEGALKRIEYTEHTYRRRTGAMVHSTHYWTVRSNTLYFEGGTVLYGITGVLKEPGTVLVRLMKSDHGEYRLEPYTKNN